MRVLAILVLAVAVLSSPGRAWAPPWAVPITLDAIPASNCGESWTEPAGGVGAVLELASTEAGDCSVGACAWQTIPGGIDLLGARLDVHLDWGGGLGGIFDAQIAIEDHCGVGCTRVLLYWDELLLGETLNQTTGVPELIATGWGSGDGQGNRLVIASCGAEVSGITIWLLGDAVGETSWSAIRALYD